MSYKKTNWKTGDVVTAAKLNNMENGIARLHQLELDEEGNLKASYNELVALLNSGAFVFLNGVLDHEGSQSLVVSTLIDVTANEEGYGTAPYEASFDQHYFLANDPDEPMKINL